MTEMTFYTLENGELKTRPIPFDHIPVYKKDSCPAHLLPVVEAAILERKRVDVISCRVQGMPEQPNNSHFVTYVASRDNSLVFTGMTI